MFVRVSVSVRASTRACVCVRARACVRVYVCTLFTYDCASLHERTQILKIAQC